MATPPRWSCARRVDTRSGRRTPAVLDTGTAADASVDKSDGRVDVDALEPPPPPDDAALPPPDAAGPPPRDMCEAYCERLDTCLVCDPLPNAADILCQSGCRGDATQIRDLVDLECGPFVERVYERTDSLSILYRDSPELAPVCDGGRDFRPTAEECAGFCDNALAACIGVGGRHFCLAGCASLTRDQYLCALEAQGDCEVIGRCLEGR